MRTVTLGTAGHIDHGKTSLVRALTGIDTDRLPEEKRRGITIDLGFAHLDLEPDLRLAITDVPGHEAFIRNMAAGASGIDLGLLVVAANEGVKPQTREHLDILHLLGVPLAAVVLTKADLVNEEQLLALRAALAQLLQPADFARAPVLPVSALTGQGLSTLRDLLRTAAASVGGRDSNDLFRLPVDRVFTVRGTGTVVTGTVWSGCLLVDQNALLVPSGLRTRVRALQRQGQAADSVTAGERAAVALPGIATNAARRGETLVTESSWRAARFITAFVHNLPSAERSLSDRQRVHLHVGTAALLARVRPIDGDVAPGDFGWVALQLEQPVAVRTGDRFILRTFSPVSTIAGGRIIEWSEKTLRRRGSDIPRLEALRSNDPLAQADAALALAGWPGLDAGTFALHVTTQRPTTNAAPIVAGRLYHHDLAATIARRLLERLADLHEQQPLRHWVNIEQLREHAPAGAARPLTDRVLTQLAGDGRIRLVADNIALADWRPRVSTGQASRMDQLMRRLSEQGLAAAPIAELTRELGADVPELARRLRADGQLIELATGVYVTSSALAKARNQVEQILTAGPATASTIKGALGLSRKHLIPLLEYFDRTGITRRIGDQRILA